MPRRARVAPGNCIYHVHNRANGRDLLFHSPACYRDFLRLVEECARLKGMRILAYCLMPNHWHMLVWPRCDGDLSRFVRRLSIRHAQRSHARNHTIGRGHIYQSRFKSHLVQSDSYLLAACRYIERNPVRARLVQHASEWPWSSAIDHLGARSLEDPDRIARRPVGLEPFPIAIPEDWGRQLSEPESRDLDLLRASMGNGTPFGDENWKRSMRRQHGFPGDPRRAGRPRTKSGTDPD